MITTEQVKQALTTVIDPELGIDVVSLGLIYNVEVTQVAQEGGTQPFVHILMTLTTPGCPLAAVFDQMVKESLVGLPDLNLEKNVLIELTFDPPWIPDMMSAEARAELGFD